MPDQISLVTEEAEVEEVFECDCCGSQHSDDQAAYECCLYFCPSCGSEWRDSYDAENCCRYCCEQCGEWHDYEEDAQSCCGSSDYWYGSTPNLPALDPYRVEIQALSNRPARLCSVEQELTDGGALVARVLYENGVSRENSRMSYHSGGSRMGYAHVEEDGSLPDQGGEVIYSRFNLANESDIKQMSLGLGRTRQLRDHPERFVRTGYEAGIHVHISARDVNGKTLTPSAVAALYELWCYAEDMLYSFSAAGWQRHRQPVESHGGYCKAVPKVEGEASPAKVWRVMNADRYFGLNFQRLFSAVSSCSCGAARMGDWNGCECGAFDGATVEWRVFNSSTLPRTIHAWLLFSHAVTAYADRHTLGTLAPNPYGSQTKSEKREVLNNLLAMLPLTRGEKAIIREAADRSPGL